MIALLLDHLWQSSLFLGGAGLLTLALRRNGANVRFWLWFAASAKFLVPFAALTAAGSYLLASLTPQVSAPGLLLLKLVAQPFSVGTLTVSAMPVPGPDWAQILAPLLLAVWGIGCAAILARWLVRWSRLRRVLRSAVACPQSAPVPVKMAPSLLEPGLVGIWRPVILLPEDITDRLSQAEMDVILAHEICHLRRRDNLMAATHMLVEALFWFHPLVWWLGARLNEERERACDESVLAAGQSPQVYAESILKVCQFYLHSPLNCAAGISGANLKTRMETIMKNQLSLRLNAAKKFLLAGAAILAIAAPMAMGLVASPPVLAQINAQVSKQNFSIRVVDETVGKDALQGPADDERVRMAHPGDGALWLKRKGQIDGDILADASVGNDRQTGKPIIVFRFTPKGRDQFAEITRNNIGHRLAVVVNGTVITAPTVVGPILGGSGQITGDFATEAEANVVAAEMMGTNHPVKP
jgi:beta-lactamase regulating signal transducer with metallopeptidase domain